MSYSKDRDESKDQRKDASSDRNDKRPNQRRNRRNNGAKRDSSPDRKVDAAENAANPSASAPARNALNDVSWYTKYPILADVASRFQFMNRPGDFLGTGGIGTADTIAREIPGIMRIEYQAAIGSSWDNSSPASICAKGIYDIIRDSYSGTLHAEPADIFMYMMHLDQFQAYIAWLKRIYGILAYYTPFNYHMPLTLFKAMFPQAAGNVTAAMFYEWVAKKNDLVNYINQLVYMCNKYVVPADMAVFDRHRWMNEGIYRDNESVLSQLYVFTPTGFWRAKGVDVEEGTEMHFIPFGTLHGAEPVSTPEQAFEYGVNMYRALADWGDAKTINGYIMRAFEGRFYPPCELMPIEYQVLPVYSIEVLLQIHNLRVFEQYSEKLWTQDPATQAILCDPEGLDYNLGRPIIDIPADIPDQGSIIIATRLNPVIEQLDNDLKAMRCGTEVVTKLCISFRDSSATTIDDTTFSQLNFSLANKLDDGSYRMNQMVRKLWNLINYSGFALAPLMHFKYQESATGAVANNVFYSWVGEITNPTLVDIANMARLHLVCQQSEFNIYNARAV